jgi:predicted metal-dependent hydrolase
MGQLVIKPNKRRLRYSLEVNDQCDIVVRTPWRSNQRTIDRLINEHQEWIEKQQEKQRINNEKLQDWHDDDCVYYRGKKYALESSNGAVSIFAKDKIYIPAGMTKTAFLTHHAKMYLPERCLDLAELMGLKPSEIRIRKMRGCWGNCHQNHRIALNQALIQTPDWVSDYVMIHECAHMVHFNHSNHFWSLVAKYTDHATSAKQWLKVHQAALLTR